MIPALAMIGGSALMAGIFFGVFSWLEGWDYAVYQFGRDRDYVVAIILAFGVQSALYSVIRFGLYAPVASPAASGAMMGTSGGTSATAMVACCLHHVTNVVPILGLSAGTAFLARYQREFLQLSLAMNVVGILVMLVVLVKARQRSAYVPEAA